jgi:hypothetical protein
MLIFGIGNWTHFAVDWIQKSFITQMVNAGKRANVGLQTLKQFVPHAQLLPSVWNTRFQFVNRMAYGAA